jgi:hypothetical protein
MGFDLHWEEYPKNAAAAKVGDAPGYFRLNGRGMSEAVDAMNAIGMVNLSWPPYPEAAAFDLPEAPPFWSEAGEPIAYPPDTPEGRFQRAAVDVLESDSGGLIPSYKLGSNDGWRVTPEEIERALAALDVYAAKHPEAEDPTLHIAADDGTILELDWWGEWIAYLRGAVDHGGIRVY